MLNIYSSSLNVTKIIYSKIVDNFLYIFYYHNKNYYDAIKLLKFNMIKRCIVSNNNVQICNSIIYFAYTYIIINKLIIFKNIYEDEYSVDIHNLDNLEREDIVHFGTDNIIPRQHIYIKINVVIDNEVYYMSKEDGMRDCFTIVNRNNSILLKINYNKYNNICDIRLENDVLYLPEDRAYIIRYYDGFLLIYFRCNISNYINPYKCVIYNLSEKKQLMWSNTMLKVLQVIIILYVLKIY